MLIFQGVHWWMDIITECSFHQVLSPVLVIDEHKEGHLWNAHQNSAKPPESDCGFLQFQFPANFNCNRFLPILKRCPDSQPKSFNTHNTLTKVQERIYYIT